MKRLQELTINWHLTEACNFGCNYCYAKWSTKKSPFQVVYPQVLKEIASLPGRPIFLTPEPIIAERIRINFAGGEPFLYKEHLEQAIVLAHGLGLSPSFISNGVRVDDAFIERVGSLLSVAGFSFDSFSHETMIRIGRHGARDKPLTEERLKEIFRLFRRFSPSTVLKINTVVCGENINEDLREGLRRLAPDRWKMLRVMPGFGGSLITQEEFQNFVARHGWGVVEDNHDMHRSYLMLNPDGKFYQRNGSDYEYGPPIMSAGALEAPRGVEFDVEAYEQRY